MVEIEINTHRSNASNEKSERLWMTLINCRLHISFNKMIYSLAMKTNITWTNRLLLIDEYVLSRVY